MCDTMIVNRKHTKEGYTIFGKNSDRSCNEPQYFVWIPRTKHNSSTVQCTYISVPQVKETYAMILSKPSWIWGAEMGVNEYGVCIGNEAVYSRETNKEPALLGMDLLRLGLERATSAKEAVAVITQLLETYGQGGNGSFDGVFHYDNSFMIADPDSTYYLETAGKYWGVKAVTGAMAISNHMMLGQPDYCHTKAVEHAKESGYPFGSRFDFAGSYCDLDRSNNVSGIIRHSLGQHMLELPGDAFTVQDMMNALRSHATDHIWTQGDTSVCKHAIGLKSESSTTNSLIVVLKPNDIEMWGTGRSMPCIAPYQPFWFGARSKQLVYEYDEQDKAMDHWIQMEFINRAMLSKRIDESKYRLQLTEIQSDWLSRYRDIPISERQSFCDRIADTAEKFAKEWISYADSKTPYYENDQQKDYWENKNELLGKDRRIAY